MGSLIASIVGWLLGKLFGKRKERELEKKYAEATKENLELRADNTGLRVKKSLDDQERKFKEDWETSDENERYEILKRDFDDPD